MGEHIRFVGLDVHANSIAVAVADSGISQEVEFLGTVSNTSKAVKKLMHKLGTPERLRVCYEAGPCGYHLYWQLTNLGIHCDVIAPSKIPKAAGERIKTDRRDAKKLATYYRNGLLKPIWVPDAEHEALRDLVRAREAAKRDQLRARNRLGKFLLRQGRRCPVKVNAWTVRHRQWVDTQKFEHAAHRATFIDYLHEVDHATERIARLEKAIDAAVEQAPGKMKAVIDALQALRGVSKITAVTLSAEIGSFERFHRAGQLMSFAGLIPSEHSSGTRQRRGAITKTGNAHLRRIVGESAWSYRFRPGLSLTIKRRQKNASDKVKEIAWRAQHRLHDRYVHLMYAGKAHGVTITAVSRELLGFIWAVGRQAEQEQAEQA